MCHTHVNQGGNHDGYVNRPYTIADAEARVAEVSSDPAFARDFFARYIQGHEVADYARLVAQAGFELRKSNAGRAWWGDLRLEPRNAAVRVASPPAIDTPAYAGGLDVDDEVRQMDGARMTSPEDVSAVWRRHRPGDAVSVDFVDRTAAVRQTSVRLP